LCRTLYFAPGVLDTALEATGNGDKVTINLNRSLWHAILKMGAHEEAVAGSHDFGWRST